jgi:hypothetical protein
LFNSPDKKPKLTIKQTLQARDEQKENQRLSQAHFNFCESIEQNIKHLISKKEKELVIFQRTNS